jgi:hypothetical protein
MWLSVRTGTEHTHHNRYTQCLLFCRQAHALNFRNEEGHVKPRVFWSSQNSAI